MRRRQIAGRAHPGARQRHRHRPDHPGAVPQDGDQRGPGAARLRGRAQARPRASVQPEGLQGRSVLVAGLNFGCGSSREHAPESLKQWGIKAIVGGSFGEIFFGNCTMLGIPCMSVDNEDVLWLQRAIGRDPRQPVTVDVEKQEVRVGRPGHQGPDPGRGAQPARLGGLERHRRPARGGRRHRGHREAPAVRQRLLGRARPAGAQRPHADPRDRLRGARPRVRASGDPAPRLPGRRARVGRGDRPPRRGGLPGAGALPAGLRADALPRRDRAPDGAAGRHRPGPARLHARARSRAGEPRGLRLGRARGLPRRDPGPLAGARPRHHRRIQRAEHPGLAAAGRRGGRAGLLVPVVLQHRARAGRARAEPTRDLPAALAGLVTGLALRRRHVRAHRGRLRQPGLRPGGDPLLPASPSQRAG